MAVWCQGEAFVLAMGQLLKREWGSQAALARYLGVDSRYISELKSGKCKISEEKRREIAAWFDLPYDAMVRMGRGEITMEELLSLKGVRADGDSEFTSVSFREMHPSGDDSEQTASRRLPSHLAFRTTWLVTKGAPDAMIVVRVDGESMAPTVADGSIVLCDESRQSLVDGKIYLVEYNDMLMIRRFQKDAEKIVLRADGEAGSVVVDEADQFRVVARCLWVGKDLD